MAVYAFAKIRFKGSKILFGLILVAMMIPYQVTQVPLYILMVQKFSMTNTYAAMILPGAFVVHKIMSVHPFKRKHGDDLTGDSDVMGNNR